MDTGPKEQALEGTKCSSTISGVETVVLSSCSPVCLSIYLIANNHYLAVTSWQMINDTWWMTLSGACPWSASLPSPLTTTWDSHHSMHHVWYTHFSKKAFLSLSRSHKWEATREKKKKKKMKRMPGKSVFIQTMATEKRNRNFSILEGN